MQTYTSHATTYARIPRSKFIKLLNRYNGYITKESFCNYEVNFTDLNAQALFFEKLNSILKGFKLCSPQAN